MASTTRSATRLQARSSAGQLFGGDLLPLLLECVDEMTLLLTANRVCKLWAKTASAESTRHEAALERSLSERARAGLRRAESIHLFYRAMATAAHETPDAATIASRQGRAMLSSFEKGVAKISFLEDETTKSALLLGFEHLRRRKVAGPVLIVTTASSRPRWEAALQAQRVATEVTFCGGEEEGSLRLFLREALRARDDDARSSKMPFFVVQEAALLAHPVTWSSFARHVEWKAAVCESNSLAPVWCAAPETTYLLLPLPTPRNSSFLIGLRMLVWLFPTLRDGIVALEQDFATLRKRSEASRRFQTAHINRRVANVIDTMFVNNSREQLLWSGPSPQ